MAGPPPNGQPEPPPAELRLGTFETSPGAPTTVLVYLTSRHSEPVNFVLEVAGLESGWVRFPPVIGPIAPGETVSVPLEVTVPVGYPPSSLVGTITARVADAGGAAGAGAGGAAGAAGAGAGATGAGGRAASADIHLTVGDGSLVMATLEPREVHGTYGGRLDVVLRNRGKAPIRVDLSPVTPNPAVELRFSQRSPVLHPGAEVRVRTRVRASRPVSGGTQRRAFGVKVQGRTTPMVLEGTLVQRPLLAGWLLKGTALVAVMALWVGVAIAGISVLSKHVKKDSTARAVAAAPPLSTPKGASAGSASSGAGGASGAGSGGSGFSAPGAPGTDRVDGKVSGPAQPGGVQVSISPTSLVDQSTQGATVAETADITSGGSNQSLGKVWGTSVQPSTHAALTATQSGGGILGTSTTPDGTWAFDGLRAPGTYLVTFSKAGYNTKKYIVTTTTGGQTVQLDASLAPGTGSITGSVGGAKGPLGDVSVTVTDGSVTLNTRTPSVGAGIGDFSLNGLSTPDSYLVTATLPGYGTQTTVVILGASGSASGVHLQLKSGVGSITGVVRSSSSGLGVSGLTVTASDATTSLSTTTTTTNPVGSYTLPNLPVPGTYALTISGNGYLTQTQSVKLTASAVVDATVTPAGADVIGFAMSSKGGGLGGAGAMLSNDTEIFKTLTSTSPEGEFDFGSVPAGQYVLSVSDFGYATASADVNVAAGHTAEIDLTLHPQSVASEDTATIDGSVGDLFDGTPLGGAPILLDGKPVTTSAATTGTYQITDVAPGVHLLTAEPPSGGDFEPVSEQVNVPLGGVVFAPPLDLPTLDELSGVVTSAATGNPVPGAVLKLLPTAGTSGTTTTATSDAAGNYALKKLDHGTYTLTVNASGYEPFSTPVTLELDQALNLPVVLTLAPSLNFDAYTTSGGSIVQAQNVCAELTGGTPQSVGPTSGEIEFRSLSATAVYQAQFWELPAADTTCNTTTEADALATGTLKGLQAVANNIGITPVYLTVLPPTVTLSLTYSFAVPTATGVPGGAVACDIVADASTDKNDPSADCPGVTAGNAPTVSLTGTVIGASGTPVASKPIPATYDGTTGQWTVSSTLLQTYDLISPSVTVNVSGGLFKSASFGATLASSGSSSCGLSSCSAYNLTPDPVTVSGTVTPASGVAIQVDPSTVTPPGGSPGGISVADANGSLVWDDSSQSAGVAQPGVYDLKASASGFDSTSQSVSIGVCGTDLCAASPPVTLSLTEQETLEVTATGYTPLAGTGATVYLATPVSSTDSQLRLVSGVTATSTETGATSTDGYLTLADGTDQVNFTYLSTTSGAQYTLVVAAPGYQTTFVPLTVKSGAVPDNVSLVQEAEASGTVESAIPDLSGTVVDTDFAGAVVSAAPSASCPAPANMPSGFTNTFGTVAASTGTDGSFTLGEDSTVAISGAGLLSGNANGGLCSSGQGAGLGAYQVTAAAGPVSGEVACGSAECVDNYQVVQQSVTLASGANPVTGSGSSGQLVLQAVSMQQEIDVYPPSGSFAANTDVSLTVTNSLGGAVTCSSTAATQPSGCSVSTGSGGDVVFDIAVYPTLYDFTIEAPGYTTLTLTGVSYASQSSPLSPLVETLSGEANTVEGTVTTQPPTGKAVAVPGLLVDLDSGNTVVATATTDSSGDYSFTNVRDGHYTIAPDSTTGYTDTGTTPTIHAVNDQTYTGEDMTVAGGSVTVKATISFTGDGANVAGQQAKLAPATGVTLPASCGTGTAPLLVSGLGSQNTATISSKTNAGGDYTASFGNVVPDVYTIVVSGTTIPAQTASAPFAICPETTAKSQSAGYTVSEGEISGTVTVSGVAGAGNGGITPVVTLTLPDSSTQTPTLTPTGTPTASKGGTFTYTAYVPDDAQVSVAATLQNYNDASGPETTTPDPTSAVTSALTPDDQTVTVTVDNSASPSAALNGVTVALTGPAGFAAMTGTTAGSGANAGTVTFDNVPPDEAANAYTATATLGSGAAALAPSPAASTQFQVFIGSAATESVTLPEGEIDGTVTLTSPPSPPPSITLQFCNAADCANGVALTVGLPSGTDTFTEDVPVGTVYVQASATGYTAGGADAGEGVAVTTTTPATYTVTLK